MNSRPSREFSAISWLERQRPRVPTAIPRAPFLFAPALCRIRVDEIKHNAAVLALLSFDLGCFHQASATKASDR
jgi:hypothetical protein